MGCQLRWVGSGCWVGDGRQTEGVASETHEAELTLPPGRPAGAADRALPLPSTASEEPTMHVRNLPRRTIGAATLAIIVITSIAACGGASSAASPFGRNADTTGSSAQGAAGAGAPSAAASAAAGGGKTGTSNGAFRDDAKIIRTGSLELQVKDVPVALRAGRDAIVGMGGYVGASQQSSDGQKIVASITYRIPVASWESALDALRGLGKEVGEKTDAAEVTDQIVDLGARIRNLQASETALVKHATEAAKIADLLEIESRLSDVRGQIEQLTAQKVNLENQAAYATLTVTFGTEIVAITQAADRWNPQAEVDRAGASLIGFLQTITGAAIWFVIVWLPMLLSIGLVAAIVIFIGRRLGLIGRSSRPLPPLPPTPAAS
jgi:hypothetical protein